MHCILDHEDLDSVVLRSAVLEVALIAIREFQFKIVPWNNRYVPQSHCHASTSKALHQH